MRLPNSNSQGSNGWSNEPRRDSCSPLPTSSTPVCASNASGDDSRAATSLSRCPDSNSSSSSRNIAQRVLTASSPACAATLRCSAWPRVTQRIGMSRSVSGGRSPRASTMINSRSSRRCSMTDARAAAKLGRPIVRTITDASIALIIQRALRSTALRRLRDSDSSLATTPRLPTFAAGAGDIGRGLVRLPAAGFSVLGRARQRWVGCGVAGASSTTDRTSLPSTLVTAAAVLAVDGVVDALVGGTAA